MLRKLAVRTSNRAGFSKFQGFYCKLIYNILWLCVVFYWFSKKVLGIDWIQRNSTSGPGMTMMVMMGTVLGTEWRLFGTWNGKWWWWWVLVGQLLFIYAGFLRHFVYCVLFVLCVYCVWMLWCILCVNVVMYIVCECV